MRRAAAEEVVAGLEIHPPARVVVGRGSAFVIGGYCYHPRERARALSVQVGSSRWPVERYRLPREDVFAKATGDAGRHAFHSGFVAVPRLEPRGGPERAEVSLVLGLVGGRELIASVGEIQLEPDLPEVRVEPAPSFQGGDGPRVAICMATFNPPPELLRRQLDSIREQTHDNWICLISDDGSEPGALESLRREIEGDERFTLAPNGRRLGFYGNFERALSMVPPSADFVGLCDQDDRWDPDKIERLLKELAGGVQLAYSDARIVEPGGALIHASYWTERRNNYTNFGSLLLANSITGAASLFRRELLDDALPFPPQHAEAFHDHWLALVALARGELAYVDEALYDYVQHAGAVIGHSTANRRRRRLRVELLERLRHPGDGSRIAYYYNWHQLLLVSEVLRIRCWERMTAAKRRTLRRLLGADRGVVGLGWLLGRRVRRLWGHDETLDRELVYAYALGRRRAVSLLTMGRRKPGRLLPRDARIPRNPAHEDST